MFFFKAFAREKRGSDFEDRMKEPNRYDHIFKIKTKKQKTDIDKYSFLNRTKNDWNKLPKTPASTLTERKFRLNRNFLVEVMGKQSDPQPVKNKLK